jgi:hypothetical protein
MGPGTDQTKNLSYDPVCGNWGQVTVVDRLSNTILAQGSSIHVQREN